jgi:hypothetical protein
MSFAEAWEKIGRVMTSYDVIRTRELQCFCLKKDYKVTKLGVGVNVIRKGRFGSLESEFDLLSEEGFRTHRIRRSVQGVTFAHWLPLPISNGHWRKVRDDVGAALSSLSTAASLGNAPSVQVIFHFMNDIVVKLNQQASKTTSRSPFYPYEEVSRISYPGQFPEHGSICMLPRHLRCLDNKAYCLITCEILSYLQFLSRSKANLPVI